MDARLSARLCARTLLRPSKARLVLTTLLVCVALALSVGAGAAQARRAHQGGGPALAGRAERLPQIASPPLTPAIGLATDRPELSGSSMRAGKLELYPGEQTSYTLTVRNSGAAGVTVDVSNPLPEQLAFVEGSASSGGVYSAGSRTVSWEDLAVPAGASVELSFSVRAGTVASEVEVVNAATIAGGGISLVRTAAIVLLPDVGPAPDPEPEPEPGAPRLSASFMEVSRTVARINEPVEYRVAIYNNGTADAVVAVSAPLPPELSYVAGSASDGGSYDSAAHALGWSEISVGRGKLVTLAYTTQVQERVAQPLTVETTARISAGDETIRRSVLVLLLPSSQPDQGDTTPPRVTSVTIGREDVLRQTPNTIQIEASDNVGVTELFVREWWLNSGQALPRWEQVRSSGWRPVADFVSWRLGGQPGTHYVGVWARDAAGNISTLTPLAIDFASVLVDNTAVVQGRARIYQVFYPAGTSVEARLTVRGGDADLYAWAPGNILLPEYASATEGQADESLSFTTMRAGIYLFAVFGYADAQFDLAITPAGGARLSSAILGASAEAGLAGLAAAPAARDLPIAADLLGDSGLDPLGRSDTGAPAPSGQVYLPLLLKP